MAGKRKVRDEELRAIEARANAATPGPWHYAQLGVWTTDRNEFLLADTKESTDGVFIANAREDVPALVAEVRRLQAVQMEQGRVAMQAAVNGDLRQTLAEARQLLDDAHQANALPIGTHERIWAFLERAGGGK